MTLRDKAEALLERAGFASSSGIRLTLGYWRKQDVSRWDARGSYKGGMAREWVCWQTLTEFVRLARKHGITFKTDDIIGEIWANDPSTQNTH